MLPAPGVEVEPLAPVAVARQREGRLERNVRGVTADGADLDLPVRGVEELPAGKRLGEPHRVERKDVVAGADAHRRLGDEVLHPQLALRGRARRRRIGAELQVGDLVARGRVGGRVDTLPDGRGDEDRLHARGVDRLDRVGYQGRAARRADAADESDRAAVGRPGGLELVEGGAGGARRRLPGGEIEHPDGVVAAEDRVVG